MIGMTPVVNASRGRLGFPTSTQDYMALRVNHAKSFGDGHRFGRPGSNHGIGNVGCEVQPISSALLDKNARTVQSCVKRSSPRGLDIFGIRQLYITRQFTFASELDC